MVHIAAWFGPAILGIAILAVPLMVLLDTLFEPKKKHKKNASSNRKNGNKTYIIRNKKAISQTIQIICPSCHKKFGYYINISLKEKELINNNNDADFETQCPYCKKVLNGILRPRKEEI